MACDFPLRAYRSGIDPSTGKPAITFNAKKALNPDNPFSLPCGRCTGCRLERSRQWAVRAMHEAQLYKENCFITLTFSNDYLPWNYSIDVRDWQLFAKRLRKSLPDKKVRFLACGEYSEPENQFTKNSFRPHYHALLFNHKFSDQLLYRRDNQNADQNLYTSLQLSKLWPYGHSTVGTLTFKSAAYVARYNMKKINGDKAVDFYTRKHPLSGIHHVVQPEFMVMSRRPGLGRGWLDKYKTDVYPSDQVIVDGHPATPPRFYDKTLTEEELEKLKRRRRARGLMFKPHQTPERRAARAFIRDSRTATYKRNLSK